MITFNTYIRQLICIGLLMSFGTTVYGQANKLIPYRKGDKWGYADNKLKVVIAPEYDSAALFQGDIAIVKKNGKLGVINKAGASVLPLTYEKLAILNSKFICFQKGGKKGISDWAGNIIIPASYQQISVLGSGPDSLCLKVTNDKYKMGLCDASGNIIIKAEYDAINSYKADNRYIEVAYAPSPDIDFFMYRGLVNRKGKIMIPALYQDINKLPNGYFVTLYPVPQEKEPGSQRIMPLEAPANVYRYELFTPSFKKINEQTLNKMIYAGKGMYIIASDVDYGLMDSTGKIILEPEYKMLKGNFNNGCITATKKKKISFLNIKGQQAFPGQFDQASDIVGTYIKVANKEDENSSFYKYGIINTHGKQLVPIMYDQLGEDKFELVNGKIRATLKGKSGLVDTNDIRVVPLSYTQMGVISEGLINVADDVEVGGQKQRKWGYIDDNGKTVITYLYDVAEPFKNGKAVVGNKVIINGQSTYQYGIINRKGKEIAPVKYSSLMPMFGAPQYTEGKFIDEKGQTRLGLIDSLGHVVIPFEYNGLGYLVHGAITAVRSGDSPEKPSLLGFVNIESGYVMQARFYGLSDFNASGYSIYSMENKSGIINKSGEIKIPATYERIINSDNEYFIYNQGDKQGLLNAASGKVISPAVYSHVTALNNGLFYIVIDGKVGYLDTEGNKYWAD